jgi:hypothetical protein
MKFISRYSNNREVTPAQYVTELICEKRAKILKIDLHYRFWTNKEWSKFYRNQINTANKLVKKFNPISIVKALQDDRTQKIYSLRAPSLAAIIEEYDKSILKRNRDIAESSVEIDRDMNSEPRKFTFKKNIVSKIKDLEHGD